MKIAIITSHLAHYRRNLYKVLDENPDTEIVHYSGSGSGGGIASIDPIELKKVVTVKNVELAALLWQKGVVRSALDSRFDAYIFTGDVKIVSTWVASLLARIRGRRVYFWTIGWHRPELGLKKWIRRSFYLIADKLLVYGDQERDMAIEHGYPASRIAVVYNSVTGLEDVSPLELSRGKRSQAVGAIARLNSVKRFELLLEAVSILKSRGLNVRVVLGGDGPERIALEEKAQLLDLEFEFLGAVHDIVKIKEFYRRVSVTVIPSAAGLTTIQSLSYGVPVITDDNDLTQMPESSAIRPGITGSRYTADNAESLADEIWNWILRVAEDPVAVAKQCDDEVSARWTPSVQGRRMLEAIGVLDSRS